ncbi:MAG: MFS transporter [Spongiibacteraceae bacterium]
MNSNEWRAVAAVALLYVFRMLGLFMLLPVLSLYAAEYDLSTPFLIGLALGIYGLGQAALQLPLGMLSDRIGRKPVIVAGLLMFAAGGIFAAAADNIYLVILGRLMQGAGAIASTLSALLADLTRTEHRSKAMAMVGVCIGLSFTLAMVVGPIVASWFGISGLFLFSAALALVGLLVAIFLVPTPARVMHGGSHHGSLRYLLVRTLRDRSLQRLNVGVFILHAILMGIFVVVPTSLEAAGLAREVHWQLYLPVMLLSFVCMLPLMLAAERGGKAREVALLAVATIAVSLLLAAYVADSLMGLYVVFFLFFVAFNLLEAFLPSLLSKMVYAGGRGTAMGVFSTCQFLGAFVGGSFGGFVMGQWGAFMVFGLAALAAALWFLVAWAMKVPAQSRPLVLSWQFGECHPEQVRGSLLALPGVRDVTVLVDDQLAHLLVDDVFSDTSLPSHLSLVN